MRALANGVLLDLGVVDELAVAFRIAVGLAEGIEETCGALPIRLCLGLALGPDLTSATCSSEVLLQRRVIRGSALATRSAMIRVLGEQRLHRRERLADTFWPATYGSNSLRHP